MGGGAASSAAAARPDRAARASARARGSKRIRSSLLEGPQPVKENGRRPRGGAPRFTRLAPFRESRREPRGFPPLPEGHVAPSLRHVRCSCAARMRACLLLPVSLVCLLAGAVRAAESAAAAPLGFAPVSGLDRAQDASALAVDAARGRLAIGDARGVWLREADGRVRRALGSGPVHDLAFGAEGALFAATERGLYEIGVEGRVARRPLGPGEAGRALRVLPTPGGVFVATGDGIQAA